MAKPRVIFVGVHYKPGKPALCSSTKSGKVVDRIGNGFSPVVKSNLYTTEFLPTGEIAKKVAAGWEEWIKPTDKDVVVLLGGIVHKAFTCHVKSLIKINHPATRMSRHKMALYIQDARSQIQSLITRTHPIQ